MNAPAPRLVWFRRDLRLGDHPALHAALHTGAPVVALFIDYTQQHALHHEAEIKVNFQRHHINDLIGRLRRLGIGSVLHRVATFADVPALITEVTQALNVEHVYFNREYLLDELKRDQAVVAAMQECGVDCTALHSNYLLPAGAVCKADGTPYQVFTPYKKRCIERLQQQNMRPLEFPQAAAVDSLHLRAEALPVEPLPERWKVGEKAAMAHMRSFLSEQGDAYSRARNFPARAGTSRISPHLAIGALSARQCLHQACQLTAEGLHSTWVSELIWRDFYRDLVHHQPSLCKHRPFKAEAVDHWRTDAPLLTAWQQGQTGFPLVDAGMRELRDTGWMHNRVRMVTAAFLAKLCLVDWRLGERHFMQHLIDGDFASNNGGWQWSSSTGADAAPYFRIFNPTSQSKKFDPDGAYIRRYVPELATLDAASVHNPNSAQRRACNYPEAVIDYRHARAEALAWFK